MTSAVLRHRPALLSGGAATSLIPGLVLVGVGVALAAAAHSLVGVIPMIVAAVLAGVLFGNAGIATTDTRPGLAFGAKTILRAGIVLLGLRLSVGDVANLGFATLGVVVVSVAGTFFGVHWLGRRLGLSDGLSLLVASGFSICGNSAIASVRGVSDADDDEVAAAVGLVTLCGTLAIAVVPLLGSVFGLTDMQLGVWVGASVQDTAQVIAVASASGSAVLAVATAVKLTRVLLLAPIVAGVSLRSRRHEAKVAGERPALLPLFVIGFLAAMIVRTSGLVPSEMLLVAKGLEQHFLAAGMVALGSAVRVTALRRLGFRPLLLGAGAWLCVGSLSLAAIHVLG